MERKDLRHISEIMAELGEKIFEEKKRWPAIYKIDKALKERAEKQKKLDREREEFYCK